jgi:hypothetical protein
LQREALKLERTTAPDQLKASKIQHEIVEADFLFRHGNDLTPWASVRRFCYGGPALSSQ